VTEFNIVHRLVAQAGEFLTYRLVYDCVHWSGFAAGCGEDGYRTNVRSSIKRIRGKFVAIDGAFDEIENFPAFGYRWRAIAGTGN
jgi:two-component system response regulator ChvI